MMSKRRKNPEIEAPRAPSALRRAFTGAHGLRAGWMTIISLAAWLGASWGIRLGLNRLFAALFAAWNINAENAARAPGWARALFAWQGSLVTLVVSLALIILSLGLRRWWLGARGMPGVQSRPAVLAWIIGTGIALVSAALFMCTDSLRPLWPISQPRLGTGLLVLWGLNLIGTLAEELFTRGVIFEGLCRRWRMVWAMLASTLVFFLSNGGWSGTIVSGVNVLLMGVLCCLLYFHHGLWAPVGFRWGWSFATVFLLGQGGGTHAVYRLLGVSEVLLTGGDAGFVYGLWLTLLLAAWIGLIVFNSFRNKDKRGTGDT